jgi:twitching motility protein PilT
MKIEHLLRIMVQKGASDLHLKVGASAYFRVNGELVIDNDEKVSSDIMEGFLGDLMNRVQRAKYDEKREFDFAVGARDLGRFRVNVFKQRNTPALIIRHIRGIIPKFETLKLPSIIKDLALSKRGLLLVTGTTGSGKSTALAAMMDHINDYVSSHIITIEDPIEFVHKDRMASFSQREIGQDTDSYANALRAALRQDPDCILVGEIRDRETMEIALMAADTGHMVFSTIHTTNAKETFNRILSMYEPHQHEEIRHMMAQTLMGIVSLRLLPAKAGGRVPAAEVLINTPAIKEYLQDLDKTDMIEAAIAEGNSQYGSQTFDQAIFKLYKDDQIDYATAMNAASNPNDFDLKVRGIESASDRSWM